MLITLTINWVPIINQSLKHINYLLVSNIFFLRFQPVTDKESRDDKLYVSLSPEYHYFRVANNTCQVRWGTIENGSKLYIILID